MGENVHFEKIPTGLKESFYALRNIILTKSKNMVLIISSPCHMLVPIAFLAGARNIVLDAGWPLTDSTLLRVKEKSWYEQFKAIFLSLCIDWLGFQLAKIVFLESNMQVKRIKRIFFRKSKFICSYTGFNRIGRTQEVDVDLEFVQKIQTLGKFALFRGSNNEESGIDVILESANHLESHAKILVATDRCDLVPNNNKVVIWKGFLSSNELHYLIQNCSIMIGQFGETKRSRHTIPHKFYEAAYYGKPYLSPPSEALQELLPEKYDFLVVDPTPQFLATKIDFLFRSPENQERLSSTLKQVYESRVSQEKISLEFLETIKERLH